MSYQEVLDYLYRQLPMYQRIGPKAYKKDLTNTLKLAENLGNPHTKFKSIHIAGTNGKGSTAHLLASVLQDAGYKTGLYTSPHLKSFRERIRVDGKMVSKEFVVEFVKKNNPIIEAISPSFFETTVVMAFDYFANQKVDIAVIETGLGGRLDSTNIIAPIVSVITSISLDHQDMLGKEIGQIAFEKAGIIKYDTPIVTGRLINDAARVIKKQADAKKAYLVHSDQYDMMANDRGSFDLIGHETLVKNINSELKGKSFMANTPIVYRVVEIMNESGWGISPDSLKSGIQNVVTNTGLKGRWQVLRKEPLTVCDIGHNEEAIEDLMKEIQLHHYDRLHMVLGVVNDKILGRILDLMIKDAIYYFCAADVPRALSAAVLQAEAKKCGLIGRAYSSVSEAYQSALEAADQSDMIFAGGSTFVVAEIKDI